MATVRRRLRIGLGTFAPHRWESVERTRRFYLRALGSIAELVDVADREAAAIAEPDAVVSFAGGPMWHHERHPPYPLLFALHGGAVLDAPGLARNARRLDTCDVLIANCSSDLAIVRRMFARGRAPMSRVLPLPVDARVFRPAPRDAARAALGLDGYDYVVGFVARLLPQKNLHGFLRMAAELARRMHPKTIAAVVIGEFWTDYPILDYVTAGYRGFIDGLLDRHRLRACVHSPRPRSDAELATCYSAMDVLVHPTCSIDENFGYVPVEAMACGVPVIGSAYGGLKDTVRSGETGYLMPTWTTDSGLRIDTIRGVDAAERLLRDAGLRRAMARAAVSHAKAQFSFARCAQILTDAVLDAIARRSARKPRNVVAARARALSRRCYLPSIARPWELFRPAVDAYASGAAPRPRGPARVQLASPLVATGDGRWRLDDPAWPAAFRLGATDLAIARACESPMRARELVAGLAIDEARLERLIRLGVLICSYR